LYKWTQNILTKMPNNHSAFRAGEYVRLAGAETLRELQAKFGWFDLTPKDMEVHAQQRVRIRAVSYFHGGTTLYELESLPAETKPGESKEIAGFWLEEALVDLCFDEDCRDSHAIYRPAHETYTVAASVASGAGMVHISDKEGRVFCSLHRTDAISGARQIDEVAKLRARANFEGRYDFDGIYS
jgi:hypothetical protein